MASVLFYQIATIGRHPVSSAVWIAVLCGHFIIAIWIMRQIGNLEERISDAMPESANA